MSLWEEMEIDGEEILLEAGRVVVFRGQQYTVLVDVNPLDEVMSRGGMQVEGSYRVRWLSKKDSPLDQRPPEFGEQVEVYGKPFTIVTITRRPPSPWIDTVVQVTD
jgi:hypothetical protein